MRKELVINIVKAILSTISLLLIYDLPATNIVVPLATFVLYFFYKNIEINKSKVIVICSAILSFFIAFGKTLPFVEESGYGIVFWAKMILLFAGFFVFFISFISKINEIIIKKKLNNKAKYSYKIIFIISFIIIILFWVPYVIAEYPSPFWPDTIAQFMQVVGDYPYNDANPFINTLYIKLLYDVASLFMNTMNDKLFLMSIIQVIINSLVYSYAIAYFYKITGKLSYVVFSLLFYSVLYFNAIYNLTIGKDTTFAIVIALVFVAYAKYITNGKTINRVLLVVMITIFGLSRTNAYYAVLFAIIVELIVFIINKNNKVTLCIVSLSFILCTLIKGPVYTAVFNNINKTYTSGSNTYASKSIVEAEKDEITSDNDVYKGNSFLGRILDHLPKVIQTQQIANVVCHDRELNEKETWLIEEASPINVIKESYNPILVDPLFKAISVHQKPTYSKIDVLEYYKLWLELFIKYPADYVEAYINMTRYYFYPNRVVRTASLDVWKNNYNVYKTPLISKEYTQAIENIANIQIDIPFLANFYSPAISVFMLMIIVVCLLVNKQYSLLLPYMLVFGIFLTLMISTPINDEFRYAYPIVNAFPLYCILPLINNKEREEKNENISNS